MKLGKALKKEKVEKLYFVAIVPPSPIYEEAFEQKVYFKTKYNSKASLNSPPHITLHMPFKWVEKNEDEIVSHLTTFAHENASVAIKLNGFSSFPPRVIFINVEITSELERLQKNLTRYFKRQLNLFNANYKELPFHPHLTLARFRDRVPRGRVAEMAAFPAAAGPSRIDRVTLYESRLSPNGPTYTALAQAPLKA